MRWQCINFEFAKPDVCLDAYDIHDNVNTSTIQHTQILEIGNRNFVISHRSHKVTVLHLF